MKTTKLNTGIYKVEIGNTSIIIKDMNNPMNVLTPFKAWEAWTANDLEECADDNCWACSAPNKKTLLSWIKEDFDKGFIK